MMKHRVILIISLILLSLLAVLIIRQKANAPDSPAKITSPNIQQMPEFDKKQYSIEDPNSSWVIVNKNRSISKKFVPQDLANIGGGEQIRLQAAESLNNLLSAAKSQGINLTAISGYRSYGRQAELYNSYVAKDGQEQADTYSARPGHSEHQTGLAVDLGSGVCDLQACFGDTPAGKWLANHAHEHGFIIRYLKDKESITGYLYEPWHLRYVGKPLAEQLHRANQTMEEFFGTSATAEY